MNINKLFGSIIILPILVSGIYGYYKNIEAMKGGEKGSSLMDALRYVDENWQEGDIIFTTDDGPWINLTPYTDHPIYRMQPCEPTLGALSPQTREAIGMIVTDLDALTYQRAWVFAPASPLHPQCYLDQIAPFTVGVPVVVVDDSAWLHSAVWVIYAP